MGANLPYQIECRQPHVAAVRGGSPVVRTVSLVIELGTTAISAVRRAEALTDFFETRHAHQSPHFVDHVLERFVSHAETDSELVTGERLVRLDHAEVQGTGVLPETSPLRALAQPLRCVSCHVMLRPSARAVRQFWAGRHVTSARITMKMQAAAPVRAVQNDMPRADGSRTPRHTPHGRAGRRG